MKRFFASLTVAAIALLANAPAYAAPSFNITDVIRASDEDLAAALADAQAHEDAPAAQCYAGIQAYNTANPKKSVDLGRGVGTVSKFQVARDVVKGVQAAGDLVPTEIEQACGWLALDVQGDLGRATPFLGGLFK